MRAHNDKSNQVRIIAGKIIINILSHVSFCTPEAQRLPSWLRNSLRLDLSPTESRQSGGPVYFHSCFSAASVVP